jgi:hypothetical protein
LVVVSPLKSWTCAECSGTGDLLTMEDAGPLCLGCADMDRLVYLPAGEAALTRRAKKASDLSAVVVRFSRARRRYERQGVLVEEDALVRAERECLADEESRARRKIREQAHRTEEDGELRVKATTEILRLYPSRRPRAQSARLTSSSGREPTLRLPLPTVDAARFLGGGAFKAVIGPPTRCRGQPAIRRRAYD